MRKRVLLIQSRDFFNSPHSGRKQIIENYIHGFRQLAELDVCTLESVLVSKKLRVWIQTLISVIIRVGFGGRSIQTTLFNNPINKTKVIDAIKSSTYDLVLIDSVRLSWVLDIIHDTGRVVVDMDDLMSNRYRLYSNKNEKLQLGIFGNRFSFISQMMPRKAATLLMMKEANRLEIEELNVAKKADSIVFTSEVEADEYRKRLPPGFECSITSQVFPISLNQQHVDRKKDKEDICFGFIGSDKVPQNFQSIEYLIQLWERCNIKYKLIIAGDNSMAHSFNNPNIEMLGFVENLQDFYSQIDALIAPSFVKGGVKTKVIEAFSWGKPVLGNAITFDGISISKGYPWILNEQQFAEYLDYKNIDFLRSELLECRSVLSDYLKKNTYDKYDRFLSTLLEIQKFDTKTERNIDQSEAVSI